MEKDSSLESGKLLFAEHEPLDLSSKVLPVFYEELEDYLSRSVDEKFLSRRETIDRSLIQKLMERKEWDEGTLKPFDLEEEYKRLLVERDSKAHHIALQNKLQKEAEEMESAQIKEKKIVQGDSDEEENFLNEEADVYESRVRLDEAKEGLGLKEKDEEDSDKGEAQDLKEEKERGKKEKVAQKEEEEEVEIDVEAERERLMEFLMEAKGKMVSEKRDGRKKGGKK